VRIVKKVGMCYSDREMLNEGFHYMFQEPFETLCTRSTQYLQKWVASYQLVMRPEKIDEVGKLTSRASKTPMKGRRNGGPTERPREPQRMVRSYSGAHTRWRERERARANGGETGVGDALGGTGGNDSLSAGTRLPVNDIVGNWEHLCLATPILGEVNGFG